MKKQFKRIIHPLWAKMYFKRTKKVNTFSKYGLQLTIYPTVFHPGVFYSTEFFIAYLKTILLKDKTLLELGAGSGLISFYACSKGANVVATDINSSALKGLRENAIQNKLPVTVIESNLFENVKVSDFDIIIINPPYYPKAPTNEMESAFYCGKEFDYFKQLFHQLSTEKNPKTEIYMILSEDCDLKTIKSIADNNSLLFTQIKTYKNWIEKNFIYQIST